MKFLHIIIYGNWLVAIAAGVLTSCYSFYIKSPNELENGLLVGFGTLFMYNFQRLISPFPPLKPHPSLRFEWTVLNKQKMWFGGLIGLLVAAVLTISGILNLYSVIVLFFAVLIGIAYATPLLGFKKPLREIPYIKIHLIALVWVLSCFVFPQLNQNGVFTFDLTWPLLAYVYFVAITIPFDMRDVLNDFPTQRTIPQLLGIKSARFFALVLMLVFFTLTLLVNVDIRDNVFFVVAVFYQIITIQLTKPGVSSDFHYSGFIDGGIILLGIAFLF